ncbi:MAG: hypothetical protein Q9162_004604 [Coniocarpon cinnabarinum]
MHPSPHAFRRALIANVKVLSLRHCLTTVSGSLPPTSRSLDVELHSSSKAQADEPRGTSDCGAAQGCRKDLEAFRDSKFSSDPHVKRLTKPLHFRTHQPDWAPRKNEYDILKNPGVATVAEPISTPLTNRLAGQDNGSNLEWELDSVLNPSAAVDGPPKSSALEELEDRYRHDVANQSFDRSRSFDVSLSANFADDQGRHFQKVGETLAKRRTQFAWKQKKHAATREDLRNPGADISKTFRFLKRHTPTRNIDWHAMRLDGHPTTLSQLQKSLRGSQVLCRPIVRLGKSYSMIVSGSSENLGIFKQNLYEIQSQHTLEDPKSLQAVAMNIEDSENLSLPIPTSSRSDLRNVQRAFETRVAQITSRCRNQSATQSVSDLTDAFQVRDINDSSVTLRSFRMGIQFYLQHGEIKAAQELLSRAHTYGLQLSSATFSLFLRQCAKLSNLTAFDVMLWKMIQHGVPVDGSTWSAFFQIAHDPSDRAQILHYVISRGLAEHENAVHHFAEPIIRQGLGNHLDAGGRLSTFIDKLRGLLGAKWASPRALQSLAGVLASRDLLGQAIEVLKLVEHQTGFTPNISILNAVLRQYAAQNDLPRAVYAVVLFSARWPLLQPDQTTFDRLWKLAWACKSVNVTKTIWQYACAAQYTTHLRPLLKSSIKSGLLARFGQEVETMQKPVQAKWHRAAGLIVVNRGGHNLNFQEDQEGEDIPAKASRLSYRLIQQDLRTARHLVPSLLFAEALDKAWKMDREWASSGLRKALMENTSQHVLSYNVPMKPQDDHQCQE